MIQTKIKKPVKAGIITGAAVLLAAAIGLLLFFLLKRPDPRALLKRAPDAATENLCLMALLERDPADAESWARLLENYCALGADPLTLQAAQKAAEEACGLSFTLPAEAAVPESSGQDAPLCENPGGIAQGGRLLKDFPGAGALAAAGDLVYLSMPDGIYAHYQGLSIRISTARADFLLPAENGLYYLNTIEKRVQYIAKDGHTVKTLSSIPAGTFVFAGTTLFIAGTDGLLYQDGQPLETSQPVRSLCVAGGVVYASCYDPATERASGILALSDAGEMHAVLPSPASQLTAGEGGLVYYINENGYPCRFDPQSREAVILKEKTARALGCSGRRVYYINEKNQFKRL